MQVGIAESYSGWDGWTVVRSVKSELTIDAMTFDIRPLRSSEQFKWIENHDSTGCCVCCYSARSYGLINFDHTDWHFEKESDALLFRLRFA